MREYERTSRLLDLDQRTEKVLRMQEQHRLAVRADLRIAVAKHARALRFQPVARGENVIDLIADVMDAAVRIALEEFRDRGVLAERLEQLDLGVRQRDEHRVHTVIRLRHHGGDIRAERIAVKLGSLGNIADRNGDVVETADHLYLFVARMERSEIRGRSRITLRSVRATR